jgi:vacuolar protein sorting-associated protein 54
MGSRAAAHSELKLTEIQELYDTVTTFIEEGESMFVNKTFYGLRGTLLTQAKSFLYNVHMKRKQKLTNTLETETWQRVEIQWRYQNLIDTKFRINSISKTKKKKNTKV